MENKKARIIIAEDHPIFRKGIKVAIECTDFAILVGEVENGQKLLDLVESTECDIVIMDIRMPVMDGIASSKILLERHPDMKIIIITAIEDENNLHELLSIGVKGFLYKDIEQEEFEIALKSALIDNIYLSKKFQTIVYNYYINPNKKAIYLTDREIEVLELILKDFSNQKIADALYRTIRTVEGHKNRLMKKTGAKNSFELKAFAIKHNLIFHNK
jgi:DNA-binding NarL/FixJ family response regulator